MKFLRDFLNHLPPADRKVFVYGVLCAIVIAVLFGIRVRHRDVGSSDTREMQPISRVLGSAQPYSRRVKGGRYDV